MVVLIAAGIREDALTVSKYYVNAVRNGGGTPIATCVNSAEEARELAKVADALLLTGGYDVNPALYNEEKHHTVEVAEEGRDVSDQFLFEAFYAAGKRILGICRGAQFINVMLGGSLIQHVPDVPGVIHDHSGGMKLRHVDILVEASLISRLFDGTTELSVNTSHHQAAGRIGRDLTITAHSDDGLIECLEGKNLLCVQWHPERMGDEMLQIFTWLASVE